MEEKIVITGAKDRRGRTLLNWMDKCVDYAREASSRGAAFIYAILGVITQSAHNFFTSFTLSSFTDLYARTTFAIIMAAFLSLALLYFVLIADAHDKKMKWTIWGFFIFESFINTFYYVNHIVFEPMYKGHLAYTWENISTLHLTNLIIAIPFSLFIPFVLKQYAGMIFAHTPAVALEKGDFIKESDVKSIRDEIEDIKKSGSVAINEEVLESLRSQSETNKELLQKVEQNEEAINTMLRSYDPTSEDIIDRSDVEGIVSEKMKNSVSAEDAKRIAEGVVVDTFGNVAETKKLIDSIPQLQKDTDNSLKKGQKLTLLRNDAGENKKTPIILE